jgi:hypothetical protein
LLVTTPLLVMSTGMGIGNTASKSIKAITMMNRKKRQ